jgi:hypothetical protein
MHDCSTPPRLLDSGSDSESCGQHGRKEPTKQAKRKQAKLKKQQQPPLLCYSPSHSEDEDDAEDEMKEQPVNDYDAQRQRRFHDEPKDAIAGVGALQGEPVCVSFVFLQMDPVFFLC